MTNKYIAFDATRYKSGGRYTIRRASNFKTVATIKAKTREEAVKAHEVSTQNI